MFRQSFTPKTSTTPTIDLANPGFLPIGDIFKHMNAKSLANLGATSGQIRDRIASDLKILKYMRIADFTSNVVTL